MMMVTKKQQQQHVEYYLRLTRSKILMMEPTFQVSGRSFGVLLLHGSHIQHHQAQAHHRGNSLGLEITAEGLSF
jgi:hypothetical protein